MEFLIENHANIHQPSIHGATSLLYASFNGHTSIVQKLIEKQADVNRATKLGVTPLHTASSNGHLEIVNNLIEKGAYVNQFERIDGFSAIHFACLQGHLNVVKILIQKRADFMTPSRKLSKYPLQLALQNNHRDVAQYLQNLLGRCLVHACQNNDFEITKDSIKAGADVNLLTKNGSTPLHLAIENRYANKINVELIEFLIKMGANVNALNDSRKTTTCLARSKKKVLEILSTYKE